MKHENRKRLEANQETALNLANEVIEGKVNPVKPAEIKAIPKKDFSVESLTNLAHNLNTHRDAARNITRYETTGKDGTPHVVRDARQYQTSLTAEELNTDKDSIYMQIISSTRAAKHMLDLRKDEPGYEQANKRLHKLFSLQFANYATQKTENLITDLKAYNGMLLDLLRKSGIDKVDDMKLERALDTTQQAMNFLDTGCHFTTITQVDDVAIVESDIAMLGVTAEQKVQLLAISKGTPMKIEWYDTLSPYNKQLAQFCAKQMLNDQGEIVKKIPTQLRYLMPFGKNMYTKFTYANKDNNGMTMVSENAHSGAIFYGRQYGNNTDRDQQVVQMAAQIQTFAPTIDTKVNQIITASPNNIFSPDDKEVDRQTKQAMEATGNTSSTTALNLFRKFTSGRKEGYLQILDSLANVIRTDALVSGAGLKGNQLVDYLKTGNGYEAAKKYLEDAFKESGADKPKLKALYVAVQARNLLDNKWPFIEAFGNNNLKLYEYFNILNFAIHNEAGAIRQGFPEYREELNKIPDLALNCMSGTNRTGVAMCVASATALERFIDNQPDVLEHKDNLELSSKIVRALNNGGHTQEYTAQNALGAHGVKMASKNSETYPLFSVAKITLTLNTARANLSHIMCSINLAVLDGIKDIKAGLLDAIKPEGREESFAARLIKSVTSSSTQNVR